VLAHSGNNGLGDIIPIPGATTAQRITENMKPAKLSEDELATIADILNKFPAVGTRYDKDGMDLIARGG